jgi:hypothetical protein
MKRSGMVLIGTLVLVAGCSGDPTETAAPRDDAQPIASEKEVEALEGEIERLEKELARAREEESVEEVDELEVASEGGEDPDLVAAGEGDVTVEMIRVYEPDETMSALKDANQFNEEPEDGFAYWMVLLEVTNRTDGTLTPWDFDFYAEGPEGVVYNPYGCGVLPDPNLDDIVAIRPDGSQQGHVCFVMREADANAVGERGLWVDARDEDYNTLKVEWLN